MVDSLKSCELQPSVSYGDSETKKIPSTSSSFVKSCKIRGYTLYYENT